MRKDSNHTIEIQEEVQIPGTDYILEEGDKIQIQERESNTIFISYNGEEYVEVMIDMRFGNVNIWVDGEEVNSLRDAPMLNDRARSVLESVVDSLTTIALGPSYEFSVE